MGPYARESAKGAGMTIEDTIELAQSLTGSYSGTLSTSSSPR